MTRGIENAALRRMVEGLREAAGPSLVSVLLYGSAARGDYQQATSDFNLLIVLRDLGPRTLDLVRTPTAQWRKRGEPMPRFFSPETLAESVDVFPVEFLDLRRHRVVLHGQDPLVGLEVQAAHLRLQCERELREKMMRLREGYLEAGGRAKDLTRLLTESFGTFVALFRGCLDLLGVEVPVHNEEVVAAFATHAGLDVAPFQSIGRLKRGERTGSGPQELFESYYEELTKAVQRVDRFEPDGGS